MSLNQNQKYFLGAAAVILATLVGTLVAYPQLPSVVPLHWDAQGNVNGWGPKWSLFLTGPGLMLAMTALFWALPWLSPKKFSVDSFRTTSLYLMTVILAMLAYIHSLELLTGLKVVVDVSRAVEGGVCLLVALLGNVLGKVRRNFYVGIRTPWTIADERVWNTTHRLGAKTFFAGGLIGLIAVVLRTPFWLPISIVLLSAAVPAIYSLVFYKQLEHRGELGSS